MGQSFEAILMQRASKEVFKKAKTALKNGELTFCHEIGPGKIRALFRDAHGIVSRVEVSGFPTGPYQSACSCHSDPHGFCVHAMAACLYHAKYTIKEQEENVAEDAPALYAGLKFAGLPELLKQILIPPTSTVTINAESEFPHMPSKWERTIFSVTLACNGRTYTGNLNNLRQLHFGKSLSVSLQLELFPAQDRQIIRYLSINAQQESSKLSLDAEQTAEFFHCLIGFERFFRMNEKVVIHKNHAEPALLVEDAPSGCILRSAIIVKDAPLPLKDVKVVAGRAGCWVGMLGEYWWICAQADVLWIRNFLRTTVQSVDVKSAKMLLETPNLPLKIIETRKIKVAYRKFTPYFDAYLRPDGVFELEILYNYSGHLCKGDHERYAAQGGAYWLRDSAGEEEVVRTFLNFGFSKIRSGAGANARARLVLHDREAVGVFVDEILPSWMNSGKRFSMSSGLAAMTGDASALKIDTRVVTDDPSYFDVEVSLSSAGIPVQWKFLAEAASRNELFMSGNTPGILIKIPSGLRRFAAGISDMVTIVPSKHVEKNGEISEILRVIRPAAYRWAKLAEGVPGAVPTEFLRLRLDFDSVLEDVSEFKTNAELFRGELRNYQKQGVRWLSAMGRRGCNLVLADEMGLGKTIQTLALLSSDVTENMPALIICPTSLIDNWAREASKFTPELKLLIISGADRANLWKKAAAYDLCITSYSLVRRDISLIAGTTFQYLILDEAQHIKNPTTANAQACKSVSALHRLVLTGTPLENSPEDLWSIFEFLHPGLLGSLASFRTKYIVNGTPEAHAELAARIAPFMLRRKKADVHKELPPKQEQALCCEMGPAQLAFYNRFLEQSRRLFSEIKEGEGRGRRFEMLSSLLRLRQICCHPELLPETLRPEGAPASAKMELLKELLMESIDSGHKVLLFSQFTSLLKIVRAWLESEGMKYEYLDGSTKNRMECVDHFNDDPTVPVFLLSLKAGGVGLNLTSADTVIIYDPWWNPAAEAQAADRTHRIGQTKPVNCIKLIVRDSIEEKVLELQKRKASLFENLVESPTEAMRRMTVEDLEFLLQ